MAWNNALNSFGSTMRTVGQDLERDRIAKLERDYLNRQREIAEEDRLKKVATEEEAKKNQNAFYSEADDMFANGVPIESRTSKNYAETMGLSMPDHGTRAPTEQDMLNLAIKHKMLGDNPSDTMQKFYLNQTKAEQTNKRLEDLEAYRNAQLGLRRDGLNETITHNRTTEDISQQNATTNKGRLAETGRHNKVTEGQTDQKIALMDKRIKEWAASNKAIVLQDSEDLAYAKDIVSKLDTAIKNGQENINIITPSGDMITIRADVQERQKWNGAINVYGLPSKRTAQPPAATKTPPAAAPSGGLTPEQRKRLEELRAKKAAGKL